MGCPFFDIDNVSKTKLKKGKVENIRANELKNAKIVGSSSLFFFFFETTDEQQQRGKAAVLSDIGLVETSEQFYLQSLHFLHYLFFCPCLDYLITVGNGKNKKFFCITLKIFFFFLNRLAKF
jgi:hypothetical protein